MEGGGSGASINDSFAYSFSRNFMQRSLFLSGAFKMAVAFVAVEMCIQQFSFHSQFFLYIEDTWGIKDASQ